MRVTSPFASANNSLRFSLASLFYWWTVTVLGVAASAMLTRSLSGTCVILLWAGGVAISRGRTNLYFSFLYSAIFGASLNMATVIAILNAVQRPINARSIPFFQGMCVVGVLEGAAMVVLISACYRLHDYYMNAISATMVSNRGS